MLSISANNKITNNNDNVTNLGLHNKDFILLTQASILVILYCDRMYDSVQSQGILSQHFPNTFILQQPQLKQQSTNQQGPCSNEE